VVPWQQLSKPPRECTPLSAPPAADVYSLHCSADSVIRYLERVDPEHADAARERYACFDKCAVAGDACAHACHSEAL